jgi:hypothetical protein
MSSVLETFQRPVFIGDMFSSHCYYLPILDVAVPAIEGLATFKDFLINLNEPSETR